MNGVADLKKSLAKARPQTLDLCVLSQGEEPNPLPPLVVCRTTGVCFLRKREILGVQLCSDAIAELLLTNTLEIPARPRRKRPPAPAGSIRGRVGPVEVLELPCGLRYARESDLIDKKVPYCREKRMRVSVRENANLFAGMKQIGLFDKTVPNAYIVQV